MNIKRITITAIIAVALFIILFLAGCSQTIYERTTTDPNGFTETIHIGHTSLAREKTLDDVIVRTDRGEIGLNRATVDNDSMNLKVKEPKTGIELGIETE